MLFDCSHCGQTLKVADNAAGKKCRCTSCERLVVIPGGKSKPAALDNQVKPSARPASVASELNDMIVRQHEQRLQEAAEIYEQQERAQRRSAEQSRVRKYYSNDPSASSSSPIRTILSMVLVIAVVLGVVCCGILGYFAAGSSAELKAGGYSITAKGGTKKTSSAVAAHGEGILNRLTGSEFWLYVTTLPSNDPAFTSAIMDRFGAEAATSKSVQRGNLLGKRFSRVAAESLNMPDEVRCEMEVFIIGNEMVVAAYIPGSSKAKAGIQRKSAVDGSEQTWDKPEAFFESLRSAAP